MALLPTKSTVAPSDLVGQQNGNLDLALLSSIGLPLARLHHTVARGWNALAAAALEAGGWALWWTSVADTYRTYAVQKAVFVDRYKPVSFTATGPGPPLAALVDVPRASSSPRSRT